MRNRRFLPAVLAIGALGALAGPAAAAPSETRITTPADPAFITYPSTGAASLAVVGTSNGKTAKVDIRCDGTTGLLLKANVTPNAAGAFGTTVSAATMSKLVGQACILRAVPANHVSTSSHFAGPRLVIGDLRLITNKAGAVIDYRVRAPQLSGRGAYSSAGSCGLQDSATFSSGYTTSYGVFTCAARLANTIGARSALQIDGVNAYTTTGAAQLFSTSSALPGLSPLTVAVSTDPATGNQTIRESEIIVKCAPDQATWPVNPATCTSFTAAGVRLDRSITQNANGRLATIIDSWTSTDGKAHKLNAVYENGSTDGAAFAFPWLTPSYTLYSTNFQVPPSPTSPFTYFAKYASAADGDVRHDQGAAVVQLSTEAIAMKSPTSVWVQEDRGVPAAGVLTMAFAYAWGATTAEVTAAAAAVQPTLALPCVVPRALHLTIAQARDSFRKAGCVLGTVSTQPSKTFKKYTIKAQTSRTGATVANGTKIGIIVSSGATKRYRERSLPVSDRPETGALARRASLCSEVVQHRSRRAGGIAVDVGTREQVLEADDALVRLARRVRPVHAQQAPEVEELAFRAHVAEGVTWYGIVEVEPDQIDHRARSLLEASPRHGVTTGDREPEHVRGVVPPLPELEQRAQEALVGEMPGGLDDQRGDLVPLEQLAHRLERARVATPRESDRGLLADVDVAIVQTSGERVAHDRVDRGDRRAETERRPVPHVVLHVARERDQRSDGLVRGRIAGTRVQRMRRIEAHAGVGMRREPERGGDAGRQGDDGDAVQRDLDHLPILLVREQRLEHVERLVDQLATGVARLGEQRRTDDAHRRLGRRAERDRDRQHLVDRHRRHRLGDRRPEVAARAGIVAERLGGRALEQDEHGRVGGDRHRVAACGTGTDDSARGRSSESAPAASTKTLDTHRHAARPCHSYSRPERIVPTSRPAAFAM
jgi:hypothetical protein